MLGDTATRFSGLGWSGPPAAVLIAIADGNVELVVTDFILDELFTPLQAFPTERKEPARRSFEYPKQAVVIDKDEWKDQLDTAEGLGESKDAPIMAALLLDNVDGLVTSNTQEFPHDDSETLVTPRGCLGSFMSWHRSDCQC